MEQQAMWQEIINAVKHEVKPATGCTEPISLAFASATAVKYLDNKNITKIEAEVSPNLMKNGMGVAVPGTGMVGLPIAAAIGAFGGDADAGLEVLKGFTSEQLAKAKAFLTDKKVTVGVSPIQKALYTEANVYAGNDHVRVCIEDSHTNIILIVKNGDVVFKKEQTESSDNDVLKIMDKIDIETLHRFANQVPFKDIEFILSAGVMNDALSKEGLRNPYGLRIATTLQRQLQQGLLSADLLTDIMIRTTASSDARMGGATLPAMTNSGSGNQGIAATMPVVVVADYVSASEEFLARALVLSHAVAIYIHSKFPPLSALCAATTASMGAAAGMVFLFDRSNVEAIKMAICNMIGDVTGIICDGASNSCAMKVSTSASSAFKAVIMALDKTRVTGNEGIVCDCAEKSIANLGALASDSMSHTDKQIIELMYQKSLS